VNTRVLLVDHQDSYTWNLAHLIARVTGELPVVAGAGDVPALRDFSHVVLSPGPGHPDDWSTGWIFDAGLPVLGVCMGMQLLVTRYGGEVTAIAPAHGVVSRVHHDGSGLFAGLPTELDVVRYHSLAATEVPADLVVTASAGDVVMAVRHRDLPLCGVQFHPESVLSQGGRQMVANFLGVDRD
jgi:anthranilate synthase/aminodeoxychorismate synthase-like glutamine amidotransferase